MGPHTWARREWILAAGSVLWYGMIVSVSQSADGGRPSLPSDLLCGIGAAFPTVSLPTRPARHTPSIAEARARLERTLLILALLLPLWSTASWGASWRGLVWLATVATSAGVMWSGISAVLRTPLTCLGAVASLWIARWVPPMGAGDGLGVASEVARMASPVYASRATGWGRPGACIAYVVVGLVCLIVCARRDDSLDSHRLEGDCAI
ncbi:hypothetical protein FJZ36_04380 [Candidatus Poribacteria bacterium]|nr:hypothetical protein [Candidatus Poribacteria bacterium]